LCARLNWQLACQFFSANRLSYRIVWGLHFWVYPFVCKITQKAAIQILTNFWKGWAQPKKELGISSVSCDRVSFVDSAWVVEDSLPLWDRT